MRVKLCASKQILLPRYLPASCDVIINGFLLIIVGLSVENSDASERYASCISVKLSKVS